MSKAFAFAGQGAQKVGMAAETAHLQKVKDLFAAAEEARAGITDLMLGGNQEELNRTLNTQPAMFVADLAYAYAAEEAFGRPDAVCGFSVGEIPALVYAGALSLKDGLSLICERARLMDEACLKHGGKMIAVVGLFASETEKIANSVENCWAVNYNAPTQTVAAVSDGSAEKLTALVKSGGGRAIPLKVSGAFHCPYMNEASEGLKKMLEGVKFSRPEIPVYANLTALPYGENEEERKRWLYKQVCSPVRFTDTVVNMRKSGIDDFVEVGPGKVLTGLIAKI